MDKQEPRMLVQELYPYAVCYRPHSRLPGRQDFVVASEAEGIIGEGITKRAAWRDAAKKLIL